MATLAISLPILVALAAFGDPILTLWLGKVPPKTYSIMIALGFVTALELPGHQCFVFLTGIGRNQLMMRMAVLGATINLIGSIIATYWLGPIGPAIGSLPAVLVIEFTILPIIVCRYLGCPGRHVREGRAAPRPAGRGRRRRAWPSPSSGCSRYRTRHRRSAGGVRAVVCATVVVLGAWAVMAAVVLADRARRCGPRCSPASVGPGR